MSRRLLALVAVVALAGCLRAPASTEVYHQCVMPSPARIAEQTANITAEHPASAKYVFWEKECVILASWKSDDPSDIAPWTAQVFYQGTFYCGRNLDHRCTAQEMATFGGHYVES